MKFAHMADCHIGGWRDPKLNALNSLAFRRAITLSIKEDVDFILIAGDLFNTAIPGIDKLKETVKILKQLKERSIPVYLIPGSHDFSPSGKTMLDVLEEAGLAKNVVKGTVVDGKLRLNFTTDEKTGVKITGMLGKRGMLERKYYEELDRKNLEAEQGFKIFMFHTSITELKPKSMEMMDSSPISLLPKGFDYYAGGHVHIVEKINLPDYKNVIYPGPLFPNNFHELEELKGGGFYIYDEDEVKRIDVPTKKVLTVEADATHKSPEEVSGELVEKIAEHDVKDAVILIRLRGELETGKVSDIKFRDIYERFYDKGAYYIMRNTSALKSKEFEEIKIETASSEDVEQRLIEEHAGQLKIQDWGRDKEMQIIKRLMTTLSSDRREGEKVYEFEDRMKKELETLLDLG